MFCKDAFRLGVLYRTIERIEMLNWDRQILEWQMKKFGWSTYAVAWIAFIKGIIIGLLVYHFFIN